MCKGVNIGSSNYSLRRWTRLAPGARWLVRISSTARSLYLINEPRAHRLNSRGRHARSRNATGLQNSNSPETRSSHVHVYGPPCVSSLPPSVSPWQSSSLPGTSANGVCTPSPPPPLPPARALALASKVHWSPAPLRMRLPTPLPLPELLAAQTEEYSSALARVGKGPLDRRRIGICIGCRSVGVSARAASAVRDLAHARPMMDSAVTAPLLVCAVPIMAPASPLLACVVPIVAAAIIAPASHTTHGGGQRTPQTKGAEMAKSPADT